MSPVFVKDWLNDHSTNLVQLSRNADKARDIKKNLAVELEEVHLVQRLLRKKRF